MRHILHQIIDLSTPEQLKEFMKGVMPSILISNVWYRYPDYPIQFYFPVMEIKYPINEDVTLGAKGQAQ